MIICPNVSMKRCVGFDVDIWLNGACVYEVLPNLQNLMVDNVYLNILGTQSSCAKMLWLLFSSVPPWKSLCVSCVHTIYLALISGKKKEDRFRDF